MRKPKATVLLVEDDPAIREGLLDVLVFNGYEATGLADGKEGQQMALAQTWDLILLDVMLPSVDGFTICRNVRKKKPGQAIIMLTAKGSEDDIVNGLRAGADDYIPKPFSLRELMARIEALLRRSGKNPGDEQIQLEGIVFDGTRLKASFRDRQVDLTRREMDIIVYLYRHMGRIVSKQQLLSDVWNYSDPTIETRTVDIHILKLRKKLAQIIGDRPIIHTVRGEGYRLEFKT